MRFIQLCFLLLLSILVSGPVEAAPGAVLHCKVHGNLQAGVLCYELKNGSALPVGKFRRPDVNGMVDFILPGNKAGVYFLRKVGPHPDLFQYAIYVHPGDEKKIDLHLELPVSSDYESCIVDNPNKETVAIQAWLNLFNTACKKMQVAVRKGGFRVQYDSLVLQVQVFKQTYLTGNHAFDQFLDKKINTDLLYCKGAGFFLFGRRLNAGIDSSAASQKIYAGLLNEKFCNTDILHSELGLEAMRYALCYRIFAASKKENIALKTRFDQIAAGICNDTLKGFYIAQNMEAVTSFEAFTKQVAPFVPYFVDEDIKAAYARKKEELSPYVKGKPGYNFVLNDINGQSVSLSSFKGKVVVADLWAMWCAPCLKEKPIFLQYEEHYKNNPDIVFVSISTDGTDRKDAWAHFVKTKGWTGIELLSNYTESVMKYYHVEGIPRFMVFDRDGKIVSVDAPRPSDPKFQQMIEETLLSGKAKR